MSQLSSLTLIPINLCFRFFFSKSHPLSLPFLQKPGIGPLLRHHCLKEGLLEFEWCGRKSRSKKHTWPSAEYHSDDTAVMTLLFYCQSWARPSVFLYHGFITKKMALVSTVSLVSHMSQKLPKFLQQSLEDSGCIQSSHSKNLSV